MNFDMKRNALVTTIMLCSVTACVPSPESILTAHPWQCGASTVIRFSSGGIVTTELKGSATELHSPYKIVPGKPELLTRVLLEDESPMRALFGGAAPVNAVDVGYADFHIILSAGGSDEVCSPIRNLQ